MGARVLLALLLTSHTTCPMTTDSWGFTGSIRIWDRDRSPIVTCDFNGITWKECRD